MNIERNDALLSERILNLRSWGKHDFALAIAMIALAAFVWINAGFQAATQALAPLVGFPTFFALVCDSWDILVRRSPVRGWYFLCLSIGAVIVATLWIGSNTLALLIVSGMSLLIFATLKLFKHI